MRIIILLIMGQITQIEKAIQLRSASCQSSLKKQWSYSKLKRQSLQKVRVSSFTQSLNQKYKSKPIKTQKQKFVLPKLTKKLSLKKEQHLDRILLLQNQQKSEFFTVHSQSFNPFPLIEGFGSRKCQWETLTQQSNYRIVANRSKQFSEKVAQSLKSLKSQVKTNFDLKSIPKVYHKSTSQQFSNGQKAELMDEILENGIQVILVNTYSLNYLEQFTYENLLQQDLSILLKKQKLVLSEFNPSLERNFYFIVLQVEGQLLEYFFWVGVPIKGYDRELIIDLIKTFFGKAMLSQDYLSNFLQINEEKNILIMDCSGRTSFIGEEVIFDSKNAEWLKLAINKNERKQRIQSLMKNNLP